MIVFLYASEFWLPKKGFDNFNNLAHPERKRIMQTKTETGKQKENPTLDNVTAGNCTELPEEIFLLLGSPYEILEPYNKPFWDIFEICLLSG